MRAFATVLLWALTTSACMTAGMMEQQPLTAGQSVLYAAHPDSLMAAARRVLGETRAQLHVQTRPDSATQVLVGGRPAGLFTNGDWARFVIVRTAPETSLVRVVSRSASLLDLGHRNRAPSLLLALDAHLDPAAVLVPGTRLRMVARPNLSALVGELRGWRQDSLVVQPNGGSATGVALGDLARLGVLRGDYGHVREGAGIGAFLGLVVGFALAGEVSNSEWFAELEQYSRVMGGMTVGTLVGAVIGSQVRSAVWSDVDVGRLRR